MSKTKQAVDILVKLAGTDDERQDNLVDVLSEMSDTFINTSALVDDGFDAGDVFDIFTTGQQTPNGVAIQMEPVVYVFKNDNQVKKILDWIKNENEEYYNDYLEYSGKIDEELKKDPEIEDIKSKIKSLN